MKKFFISITALMILLLTSSFLFVERANEDVRKLNSFDGIGISIHADVFYTQGNSHEIRIEGADKDIRDLVTEVRDDFLQVKFENHRIKRGKLTLYITSNELEAVKLSGSGNFNAEKPVSSEEMDLAISGSGGITFGQLNAEEVGAKISGSGDIELLKGSAEEFDIRISGSGHVRAENFEVSECSASLSGSGSVKITAKDELEAKMSGSGKVSYHGDPQVNSISSGSGKVVAL